MIEIYDNGGETFDRYTIIINDDVYGMSANPNSPQGFNQYSGKLYQLPHARYNGERVTIESLPEAVQRAIEDRQKTDDGPLTCPGCKASMEYRSSGVDTAQDDNIPVEAQVTHMWSCPDCPMICFEYINDKDIDALKTLIK